MEEVGAVGRLLDDLEVEGGFFRNDMITQSATKFETNMSEHFKVKSLNFDAISSEPDKSSFAGAT